MGMGFDDVSILNQDERLDVQAKRVNLLVYFAQVKDRLIYKY